MIIKTDRLILRPFSIDDASDVFEYLSLPQVNCFANMRLRTIEEAIKRIKGRDVDGENCFAIALKDSGKVIGELFSSCESSNPESKGKKDVYSPCWMLNPKYQGKGYAYEAAEAYLSYLFNEKGARRIYAYVEDYNYPSQHLCERLGMRFEGKYKEFVSFINDESGNPIYENTCEYAILKTEWNNIHNV